MTGLRSRAAVSFPRALLRAFGGFRENAGDTSEVSTLFKRTRANKLVFATEDAIYSRSRVSRILMNSRKVPISEVQALKTRRDELFRKFEDHPGRLALAREIKDIDDQIAELTAGKKKTGSYL